MAFTIASVLGTVLQVGAAGGGDDQNADAMPADAASASLSSPDLAAVKAAIALARKGDLAQASDVEARIGDPVARKVAEWAILRSDNKEVDFRRYVAFISDNPSWPNIGVLCRRAEAALWKERLGPQMVRAYFDKDQPLTAQGKFALARALLLDGERAEAQKLVREVLALRQLLRRPRSPDQFRVKFREARVRSHVTRSTWRQYLRFRIQVGRGKPSSRSRSHRHNVMLEMRYRASTSGAPRKRSLSASSSPEPRSCQRCAGDSVTALGAIDARWSPQG